MTDKKDTEEEWEVCKKDCTPNGDVTKKPICDGPDTVCRRIRDEAEQKLSKERARNKDLEAKVEDLEEFKENLEGNLRSAHDEIELLGAKLEAEVAKWEDDWHKRNTDPDAPKDGDTDG